MNYFSINISCSKLVTAQKSIQKLYQVPTIYSKSHPKAANISKHLLNCFPDSHGEAHERKHDVVIAERQRLCHIKLLIGVQVSVDPLIYPLVDSVLESFEDVVVEQGQELCWVAIQWL